MHSTVNQACEQQVIRAPNIPEPLASWAKNLYLDGRYSEAEQKYVEALSINAQDGDTHYNLGNLLYKQQRFDEANNCYIQATAYLSEPSRAFFMWGKVKYQQKEFNSALPKFNEVVRLCPTSAEAQYMLGNTYIALGHKTNAIAHYLKAIELDPTLSMAYNNLGNVYAMMGKHTEALEKYYQAITIEPLFAPHVYPNWDKLLSLENPPNLVINDSDLKFSYVYYQWANSLADQREYQKAIQKYERASKINPDYDPIYYGWAYALEKIGKHDEAQQKYHRSATPDSSKPQGEANDFRRELIRKVTVAFAVDSANLDVSMNRQTRYKSIQEVQAAQDRLNKQVEDGLKTLVVKAVDDEISAQEETKEQIPEIVKKEQEEIYAVREMREYYDFMQKEFNTMVLTAFIVSGDRFEEKGDPVLAFLSWAADFIPTVGSGVSYLIDKVNDRQVDKTNEKYVRCIKHFVSPIEAAHVIEYIARKLTLRRKKVLISQSNEPRLDCSLIKNKTAKKFLKSDNINSKAEERAFMDLAMLLVECFLQPLPIDTKDFSSNSKKVLTISRAVLKKMEECITREEKEGNPWLKRKVARKNNLFSFLGI